MTLANNFNDNISNDGNKTKVVVKLIIIFIWEWRKYDRGEYEDTVEKKEENGPCFLSPSQNVLSNCLNQYRAETVLSSSSHINGHKLFNFLEIIHVSTKCHIQVMYLNTEKLLQSN